MTRDIISLRDKYRRSEKSMKMHRNSLLIALMIVFGIFNLSAGNSIFSVKGMPYLYSGNDIYSQGMGDVGIGDGLRLVHGYSNPALINTAGTVNFYTGIKSGYVRYNTEDEGHFTDEALDFPFFSIVAPYRNHRFAFQFNSYKSGNVQNRVVINDGGEDGENSDDFYAEENLVDSYIYKLDLFYGYRLTNGWSLGAGPNVYIGHREQEYIQDGGFDNTGSFNARYKMKYQFTDVGFTAGLLKQSATWSLGAKYELGRELNATKEFLTIHSTEELSDDEYKLPHRFGAGFAKKWSGKFKLAADVNYEIWDDFLGTDYHNSWKVGLGFAYEPKLRKKGFWKYIPLRAGVSLRELPFDYNDEKIYEQTASVGFSLPLHSKIDKLDFAFEYMIRGDVDTHGVEDRSMMFLIGFSGFDIFKKVYKRTEPREIPIKEDLN
jgi:hypothetical protein